MIEEASQKQPAWLEKFLMRLPMISDYAEQRGVAFVISYVHRITGIFAVGFVVFHLWTLQALNQPAIYDVKMRLYSHPLLIFLEWALALPIMLHALNGGRLVLFESFGCRKDNTLLTWAIVLWLLYCSLLGTTMLTGTQPVTAGSFWIWALAGSGVLVYFGAQQIWPTAHRLTWKLQRLSGLFLIIMVPAHLLFMHLNPMVAKDAGTVLARIQNPFIKIVDILLAVAVLYHGAYGLISIAGDYIADRLMRRMIAVAIACAAAIFGILALRLLTLG